MTRTLTALLVLVAAAAAAGEDGPEEGQHSEEEESRSEADARDLAARFDLVFGAADANGDGVVDLAGEEAAAVIRGVMSTYEVDLDAELGMGDEEIMYVLEELAHSANAPDATYSAAELAALYLHFEYESGAFVFPRYVDDERALLELATEEELQRIRMAGVFDAEASADMAAEHAAALFGAEHFPEFDLASDGLVCSRCVVSADEIQHALSGASQGGALVNRPGVGAMTASTPDEVRALLAEVCEHGTRVYDLTLFYEDEGGARVPGYAATPTLWTDAPTASQKVLADDCRALVERHADYLLEAAAARPVPGAAALGRRLCAAPRCEDGAFELYHTGGVHVEVMDDVEAADLAGPVSDPGVEEGNPDDENADVEEDPDAFDEEVDADGWTAAVAAGDGDDDNDATAAAADADGDGDRDDGDGEVSEESGEHVEVEVEVVHMPGRTYRHVDL